MKRANTHISCGILVLCSLFCSLASAININLVYPGGNLFSATHDPAAKDSITAAAADISAAITSNLSAINTDIYTGTNGDATAIFDWRFQYNDPVTTFPVTINSATIPASTVTMYVGARSFLGITLGEGGPSGAGFNLSGSYNPAQPNQWPGAVASAESLSELAYKRGGGPVIGTLSGSSSAEGFVANYSMDYGVAYGALSLDWDGNNNGIPDNDTELGNFWHFNHSTPVVAGKNDLYSVALHEMIHALGIGSSASWTALRSGSNWTGSNVIALHGTGTNLVASGHIAEGIMSTRASDGVPQEVVMDPSINQGTRKYLTALDLAFLRDIGYTTIIPMPSFSPADFNQDGDVDSGDLLTWQNGYGLNANGDTDSDGDSDGRDFLLWQREYTGPLPFTATISVPEPSTMVLFASGLLILGRRRP